jgi:hypothetical protein
MQNFTNNTNNYKQRKYFEKFKMILKYKVFSFFLNLGVNIYAKQYKIIPQATNFFRN